MFTTFSDQKLGEVMVTFAVRRSFRSTRSAGQLNDSASQSVRGDASLVWSGWVFEISSLIRFFVQPDLVAFLYPTMTTRDMILNPGRERWTSTPCMLSFRAIKRNNQTEAYICTEIETSHANIV